METGYHFGGYARRDAELDAFIRDFEERHAIALEWVYVAKMMYGVFALVRSGHFAPGSRDRRRRLRLRTVGRSTLAGATPLTRA